MKTTNEELLAALQDAEGKARSDTLNETRTKAQRYYNGEPLGNELPGRSQVVDRTVYETIEAMKPALLKVFVSGDDVCLFQPRDPSDEAGAKTESQYVNWLLLEKNDGVQILNNWFHDALLMGNGYVRVMWDDTETLETESYKGLNQQEVMLIMQDPTVEVVSQEEILDPQYGPVMDLTVRKKQSYGCVKVQNLPPEQVLVSHALTEISLHNAEFVQYWDYRTLSQLRQDGFEVPDDLGDGGEAESALEWERNYESDTFNAAEDAAGKAGRRVKVRESWLRYDANGDGKSELLHLITVGTEILLQEEADEIPIACICPVPLPHRHNGLSIADAVLDLQEIKTYLVRGYIDNLALANNGRYGVSDRVNLADMLTSRPGGVIRVEGDPAGAIMPIQHPMVGPAILQGMEFLDASKEVRTGVTRYNQGLDANSLNKTATGVSQILSQSQLRMEMIARLFAEGVKQLVLLIHKMTKQNATQPEMARLNGQWVPVDPRTWKTRYDLQVSVGLGTGNKDQQLAHLSNLFQMQMALLQAGLPVVQPQNVYETIRQIAHNAGFRQPDQFVTNPQMIPPQPPQQNPMVQVEQMKLQAKQQEVQMQAQMDVQKFQAQAQVEAQKAQAQLQQEQLRSQNDVAIEQAKIQAQMELERWKAELEAQTTLEKAKIDAEAKIAIEQYKTANQPPPASVSVNNDPKGDFAKSLETLMAQQAEQMRVLVETLSRPKQIVRGPDGRAVGVQ